jgi:hypothetical protein
VLASPASLRNSQHPTRATLHVTAKGLPGVRGQ